MKNTFYPILLLFVLNSLTAQDWAPVRMGERYNFQQSPADVITQTLWADSVKVVNGDSVWYMNRTVRRCDTCTLFMEYYGNQPFFLGKEIAKQAYGHYLLIATDTIDFQAFRQRSD
jgi:hypothetical protein